MRPARLRAARACASASRGSSSSRFAVITRWRATASALDLSRLSRSRRTAPSRSLAAISSGRSGSSGRGGRRSWGGRPSPPRRGRSPWSRGCRPRRGDGHPGRGHRDQPGTCCRCRHRAHREAETPRRAPATAGVGAGPGDRGRRRRSILPRAVAPISADDRGGTPCGSRRPRTRILLSRNSATGVSPAQPIMVQTCRKGDPSLGSPFREGCSAVSYSPTLCRVQYHRR